MISGVISRLIQRSGFNRAGLNGVARGEGGVINGVIKRVIKGVIKEGISGGCV